MRHRHVLVAGSILMMLGWGSFVCPLHAQTAWMQKVESAASTTADDREHTGGQAKPNVEVPAPKATDRNTEGKPAKGSAASQSSTTAPAERAPAAPAEGAPNLSVTQHTIHVAGEALHYTATAGLMPIHGEDGRLQAEIFFVAYTRDNQKPGGRPILFAFNGGPGAASIWLHLAAFGPKRVVLAEGGTQMPSQFRLVDNEYTWLDFADLVFIDPVGTGFSRAAPGIDVKQFYGIKPDAELIGQFIRLYVTQYGRWLSPKYIAGESYGTTRAVAVAGHLQNDVGMLVNGLVLISSALDFSTLMFGESNDLPYILYLPSYTATAWYHHKLPPALQNKPLAAVLQQAQRWANVEYRVALAMGDDLSDSQRDQVVQEYAWYTGLPQEYVRWHHLRVSNTQFMHEILRDCGRVVGILDGRVTGLPAGRENFVTDPSVFITIEPLVATLYHYVSHDLHYHTDRKYEFLNPQVSGQWNWGSATEGYPSVLPILRQAMSANTHLRVHMACGYYDLDTGYMAQKYTADHLLLDRSIEDHIEISYYLAGHQLYTFLPALARLTENVRAFVGKQQ